MRPAAPGRFSSKVALGLLAFFVGSSAAPAEFSDAGFAPERLHRIHDLIAESIAAQKYAGAVALVSRDGKIAYWEAQGSSDLESRRPMAKDATFRVCSMTKPVVGVAVLMLVEAGKIRLTDPVSRFIPEFRHLQVAPEPSKPGETIAANREITVRDLLTHTSGLGSSPASEAEIKKLGRKATDTLASFVPKFASTPLDFQPGSRWHYSGLAGFDTLARIVEIASGMELEQFLQQRLFSPLGMKSTSFAPSADLRARLATVYLPSAAGLERAPYQEDPINPVYQSGGSGLVSTAEDYFRFAQMLAGGGQFNGVRILSPRMVELMRSELVSETVPGRDAGEAWGLSVRVISKAGNGTLLSGGSFGWSGSDGTHFWVDPREKLVAIFMIQLGKSGGSGAQTARDFETAVMQSLVELN